MTAREKQYSTLSEVEMPALPSQAVEEGIEDSEERALVEWIYYVRPRRLCSMGGFRIYMIYQSKSNVGVRGATKSLGIQWQLLYIDQR